MQRNGNSIILIAVIASLWDLIIKFVVADPVWTRGDRKAEVATRRVVEVGKV